MMRSRQVLLGVLGLLFFPCSGHSQMPGEWGFTPYVGLYLPVTDIGPVAPVSDARYLKVEDIKWTLSFGFLANRGLSIEGMALSFRGLVTLSANAPGTLECFPGLACLLILLRSDAEVWVWSGVAGLLYHPLPEAGSFSPFVTAGVGLKQNRFSWPGRSNWGVDGADHTETLGTLQFGVGFDIRFGDVPVRLEVSDYWTARGDRFTGTLPDAGLSGLRDPQRASQHDLNISLGWILSFN